MRTIKTLLTPIAAAGAMVSGALAAPAFAEDLPVQAQYASASPEASQNTAAAKKDRNGSTGKRGTTDEKEVYTETNLRYYHELEVPAALDNEIRFAAEQDIRSSPLPHILKDYEENRDILRFAFGKAAHRNTPDTLHTVVVGFFDENGNGLYDGTDEATGRKSEPLLGIPNNTFEGMANSPVRTGEIPERLRTTYADMLEYRILAKGVMPSGWKDNWFQDMNDYTMPEKDALVMGVVSAVGQGIIHKKDYLSPRIVNDFSRRFGEPDAPLLPESGTTGGVKGVAGELFRPIVYKANTGDWYVAVFRDDDGDGTADVNEPFLDAILKDGISAFMKIGAPDCPTIIGRGPSCPEKAEPTGPAGVGGTGTGVKTTITQPENSDGLTLGGAVQVAVMGNITEALNEMPYRSGDVALVGHVSLGRIYTALKIGGWWRESHDANELHTTSAAGARTPLEGVLVMPAAIEGSIQTGYDLNKLVSVYVLGRGNLREIFDTVSGTTGDDLELHVTANSVQTGAGASVSLLDRTLRVSADYAYEFGRVSGELAFYDSSSRKIGSEQVIPAQDLRGHTLRVEAVQDIGRNLYARLRAGTEGNAGPLCVATSACSGGYGRATLGGELGYRITVSGAEVGAVGLQGAYEALQVENVHRRHDAGIAGLFARLGPAK